MGILGVVGAVLLVAIVGLAAFGALMIFARGMSDVPLSLKKNSQTNQDNK